MAQKIPFFELFTDFSPDFDLRVPLNAAMVTNMVLEPEKRTMTLDMTVRAEMNDSTRETVEQLLARNYDLKRVDIHVKSTAEAFPDMLKNAGGTGSGSGSVIMGREIAKGRVLPISELTPKAGHVVVEGKVFKFDCHETRRAGVWTMLLEMTDYEGSLFIRRSMPEREATELLGKISVGMWLRVSGRMELSYDGKDMQLNPQDIMQIDHAERTDTAEEKRVELHLHTRMSNMDALTDTAAVVKRAIKWGMPAIAITDHGVAQSFPDAWHTGEGKIKLLYGCEGYFLNNIDDRICVHGPQDGDFSTEICCFDIETTGLKVAHDAITEIGAVILKDGEIVDTFQTFVDPERRLSPEIIGLTGITDDMLRGAPKLEDALHAFLAFAGGRPLAAHNAEFDISFIRAGCKKCGIPFEPTYLDSLIFAQNLLPELGKYKLDIVADHLQLPQFNHHRASDDAVPVAQMLAKFFVMLEERGVTRLQQINDEMTKLRPLGVKRNRFPKHIILIAKNKVGLKNLYQLISASNLKYFKRVPIIPKSELVAHREGLIIGSACEAGELFRAIVDHKDWNDAVGLLTPYIIQSEYGVILADGLELIAHTHHFDSVGNLPLDVAGRVDFPDGHIGSDSLTLGGVKVILLLQLPAYILAAVEVVSVGYCLAVSPHTEGYYMDMVPVDVHVFENQIRHISQTHFLHILVGQCRIVGVAQTVVGMRIEGNVHHRSLGLRMRRHPAHEILIYSMDVHRAGTIIIYFVGVEQPAFFLVDFLPVIADCAVKGVA
mgnify:CR=1 FL=1